MTKPNHLPSIRLYSPLALAGQEAVALGVAQSHYLINVMRVKNVGQIRLFHESGGEWLADVSVQGKHATATLREHVRDAAPALPVALAFCPLRSGKTERLVEKATELGAQALYPVLSKHTVATRINADKLRQTAIEAAEQSERLDVPAIAPLTPLAAFLESLSPTVTLVYGDESGASPPLNDAVATLAPPLCALVGPEGGFCESEFHLLRRHPRAVGVTLGPRILKADTAALTLLSILGCHHGDWQHKPSFRSPSEAS